MLFGFYRAGFNLISRMLGGFFSFLFFFFAAECNAVRMRNTTSKSEGEVTFRINGDSSYPAATLRDSRYLRSLYMSEKKKRADSLLVLPGLGKWGCQEVHQWDGWHLVLAVCSVRHYISWWCQSLSLSLSSFLIYSLLVWSYWSVPASHQHLLVASCEPQSVVQGQ